MVVLDVLDELRQGWEVEPAAPEPAGVGEEGGGGDACHGVTSRSPCGACSARAGGGRAGRGGGRGERDGEREMGREREREGGGGEEEEVAAAAAAAAAAASGAAEGRDGLGGGR